VKETTMIAWRGAALATVVVSVIGCATPPPPKELVDARAAYSKAQSGAAGQLTPAQVHEAKVALDSAERVYVEEGDSANARDVSYVALRKAEWAQATGNAAEATKQRDQAQLDLQRTAQQQLGQTQAGLAQAQADISKTKQALTMTAEQLAAEKKAREAAEGRAREAMSKLASTGGGLSIKDEPRGNVITVPASSLFASAKADLLPAGQEKLNLIADALKNQQDEAKITVEGHTDNQGNEGANMELSTKRAQAVKDYLVTRGVKAQAITATGVGQGRPAGDNSTPGGREKNRRVEIIVAPLEKKS
jgi:outer membrane protein OmpA-like peptidoglycan-associated protein